MTTPCVTDLALPPDDGAICSAIEELRTKIAAWASAVAKAESRLADRAADLHRQSLRPAESDAVETHAQAGLEAAAEVEALPPTDSRILEASDPPTDLPGPCTNAAESLDEAATARSEASIEERNPLSELESFDPSGVGLAEAGDLPPRDDENLLAALPPEVAEAIRVQHRLFAGRRSIRELIEAHRDNSAESREKRRWWQRGNR